jgi:hypothetical protein
MVRVTVGWKNQTLRQNFTVLTPLNCESVKIRFPAYFHRMNRVTLRPQRFLILLPVILAVISAMAFVITISGDSKTAPLISAIVLLLLSLTLIFNFFRSAIILDESMVISQSFFRTDICEFRNIERIETKVMTTPSIHGVQTIPMVILHSSGRRVTILIKSYSKKSLVYLAQWLMSNTDPAISDTATHEMAAGKMPGAFRKKRSHHLH